jgi:hypothetical protein
MFETWQNEVPEKEGEAFVFPPGTIKGFHCEQSLTRYQAKRIIKKTTGKFPHWFRAK